LHPGQPVRPPSLRAMPFAAKFARVTARTSSTRESRAIETTFPTRPTSAPLPARVLQGRRLRPTALSRPNRARPAPVPTEGPRPNTDDIRCVRAVNFAQFCKQKDVRAMRMCMTELVDLVCQEETRELFEQLPLAPVEIPNLSEESFRRLVEDDYTLEEAYKVLPEYFHGFVKNNLDSNPEFLRRKIVDADVEKFLKGKPALTRDDILQRLPKEFRHHVDDFLPKNADELPPHRPWDHKIEITPG